MADGEDGRKSRIAVFDFDGTLTDSDSMIEFIRYVKGDLSFAKGLLYHAPLLLLFKLGLYSPDLMKERLFSYFFKGKRYRDFIELCADFYSAFGESLLKRAAVEAVTKEREKSSLVIIVSASVREWIEPFSRMLGIDTVIATELEVDERGLLTGRFSTPNCNRQEKVNRLKQVFGGLERFYISVYGDSEGDAALFEMADEVHYRAF